MNADGTVKSHQKISDTAGGFTGALDNDDEFGISVASLGDLDGDLVPDLAVGAWFDDDGDTDRGAVYILFINTDGTVKSHQKITDTAGGFTGTLDNGDEFGVSIANLSDLDGDGVPDLVVGAERDDDGGFDRGAVWILFMKSAINPNPDLSLTKADSPNPVAVGSSLTYTLTATNASTGAGVATGIFVTDTLPAGVTFNSATASQGTVDPPVGLDVVWDVGTLTQGQSETVDIVVTVDSTTVDGTVLTNTAVVVGSQPDPIPGNNSAVEETTAVLPVCTLELTPSYESGTLTVDVLLGTNVAATANLWGTAESNIISIFTGPVPVIEPTNITAINSPLPPSGTVGILATLTLPELSIICSDFKTVDTGSAP